MPTEDQIETLTKAFDDYHAEATRDRAEIASLKAAVQAERKEREDLEARMNRSGTFGGGGNPHEAEMKATGEALRKYIAGGDKSGFADMAAKGMSVGSDPDGGYTVMPAFSAAITAKVFESSPLRRLARVVSISTDSFEEILDRDEPASSWVAETASRPATTSPQIGKFAIPVHEHYAAPKVTQKLLDDSNIDIGGWLTQKIADKFARGEASAFVSGNGVGKPRGFLDYSTATTDDDSRTWGVLQYVPSGASSDFASTSPADALIDLQSELKADYRNGAVWLMNRKTAGKVRKFKDGEGNYLWQPSAVAGQPALLLGHPVELAEDMPDVGAGAYPIAFGNFARGYTVVDRHGVRLMRDPYTDKPHVVFYTYARVGGDVNDFDAIKLLKIATS